MVRPRRVAILNDHAIVIAGLVTVLAGTDIELVEATTDLAELAELDVDVVLLDTFGRPDAAQRIAEVVAATRARVLVFSWAPTSTTPWGRLDIGAAGYVSKSASEAELIAALRGQGAEARTGVEPTSGPATGAWPGRHVGMSARESEVIALVATGISNDDIAALMFLSLNTIKTYIRSAYRKAGVHSRSQAVRWALENGFNPAGPPLRGHDGLAPRDD